MRASRQKSLLCFALLGGLAGAGQAETESWRSSADAVSVAASASWHGSQPGSPRSIAARIQKPYDPSAETTTEYFEKLDKYMTALRELGDTQVSPAAIDELKDRAQVLDLMYTSKTARTTEAEVSFLKKQLLGIFVDADDGYAPAAETRISTLRTMLSERGADGPAIEQRYRRGGLPTPSPRRAVTPPPRQRTQYHNMDTPPPSPRQSQVAVATTASRGAHFRCIVF